MQHISNHKNNYVHYYMRQNELFLKIIASHCCLLNSKSYNISTSYEFILTVNVHTLLTQQSVFMHGHSYSVHHQFKIFSLLANSLYGPTLWIVSAAQEQASLA